MRKHTLTAASVFMLCACCLLPQTRSLSKDERCKQPWRISFPDVVLEPNERIWGVELKITTGRVLALNYVPADWSMTIDTGYGDSPSISGHAGHGASCLFSTDELRGFATVCDVGSTPEKGELPFAVEGTLVTITDFQTETTRSRAFTMDQLILRAGASNNAAPDRRRGARHPG